MASFNTKEIFDHHVCYHVSGMGAPWCIFCPGMANVVLRTTVQLQALNNEIQDIQSSLPSGELIGGEVSGSGTLTAAELRTSGVHAGVRSNVKL